MSSIQNQEQPAFTFEKIFNDELKVIGKKEGDSLIGLALSGGGIRSATFNLGVIQGLAESKFFDKIDYLSTVSGGGYIGSWLSAWIYHKSQPNAEGFLKSGTTIQDDLTNSIDANNDQSEPVKFLRNYSNYLTPHASLFSMDTLSAVSNYTRNFILNQSILILALALVLMSPRFLQKWGDLLLQNTDGFWHIFIIGALFLIVAVGMISYNLVDLKQINAKVPGEATSAQKKTAPTTFNDFITSSIGVFIFVVIPVLIGGWLTALILVNLAKATPEVPSEIIVLGTGGIYLVLWAVGYLITVLVTQYQTKRPTGAHTGSERTVTRKQINKSADTGLRELLQWAVFTFIAGCIGGGLFLAVIHLLVSLNPVFIDWLVVVFGPPVVVSIFALIVVFHIGLMGRDFSVSQHEWWNRLGAPLITIMAAWLGVLGIAVFGPPALERLNIYLSATLTTGWLATTIAGVFAGKSSATGGEKGNNTVLEKGLELVAQIAPYIFIIGILLAVSCGLQWAYSPRNCIGKSAITEYCPAAEKNTAKPCFDGLVKCELEKMDKVTGKSLISGFVVIFIVLAVLAWRVKINLFSLHNFYRNRLTRAYLGASRPLRNPHPFTGFDENDDIALCELAKQRPYHIINTAINFTDGGELAVQDRKAAPFVFTPNYCGYQLDAHLNSGFYRRSKEYGKYDKNDEGFLLGSAVAVSGAAVSPNMGYHSSPAVAFLLTMFNVRLGRWCGNPGNVRLGWWRCFNPGKISDAWRKSDPVFGLWYLLSELFGYANLKSEFINLSDGGHFENLGLYELVRRGCSHIVVCDAGADEKFNFEDLAGAIRKCRTDFAVNIDIDLAGLRYENPDSRYGEKHYALGTIDYGSYWKDRKGTLILLKPSLTETDLPADVRNYADMNDTFPQQSTADQWFDEAQFESYRRLGHHVVKSFIADLETEKVNVKDIDIDLVPFTNLGV